MIAIRPAFLCAALILSPAAALAQVRDLDPVEEHLRLGVELRRSGHDEEAVVEFEAAYSLRREPRTAAQLGLACQAAGRWLRADALLRQGLASPEDAWIARNRAALDGALAVVGRHLASVELVGDIVGARVRVNGDDAGTLPLPGPVRVIAGTVAVDVTAEGFEALSLRFVAAAGENLRERVSLVPSRPSPPPVPPASAPPAPTPPAPTPALAVAPPVAAAETPAVLSPTQRPPWGTLAVASFAGAAVLIAGGVTALVLRESSAADYNSGCDPGDARGSCGALRDRAAATEAIAWTTLPLGALLAGAGGYFLLRDRAAPARTTARNCEAGLLSVRCGFAF